MKKNKIILSLLLSGVMASQMLIPGDIVKAKNINQTTTITQYSKEYVPEINNEILKEISEKGGNVQPNSKKEINLSNGMQVILESNLTPIKNHRLLRGDSFTHLATLTCTATFIFHGATVAHFKAMPQCRLTRYETDVTIEDWSNERFYIGSFNGSYSNKSVSVIQRHAQSPGTAKIKAFVTLNGGGYRIPYTGDLAWFINISCNGSYSSSFETAR